MRPQILSLVLVCACADNLTPEPTASPAPPLGCLPDLDGTLTAAEVPVVLGVPLDFYVGAGVTVDVAGASPSASAVSAKRSEVVCAVGISSGIRGAGGRAARVGR